MILKSKPSGNQFLIACVAFLVLEIGLYLCADRQITLYFSLPQIKDKPIVAFFYLITDYGKAGWYLWPTGILTILCFFLVRGKDVTALFRHLFGYMGTRALFLFSGVGLSSAVTDIIKPLLGRARPTLWLHNAVYGFNPFTFDAKWSSMPSGHTTTIVALAYCLNILYPKLRIVWCLGAFLIALSRIVVCAHFVSDVVAGAFMAWLTVTFYVHYGKTLSDILFVPEPVSSEHEKNA